MDWSTEALDVVTAFISCKQQQQQQKKSLVISSFVISGYICPAANTVDRRVAQHALSAVAAKGGL